MRYKYKGDLDLNRYLEELKHKHRVSFGQMAEILGCSLSNLTRMKQEGRLRTDDVIKIANALGEDVSATIGKNLYKLK